jgi:hypothetical protein
VIYSSLERILPTETIEKLMPALSYDILSNYENLLPRRLPCGSIIRRNWRNYLVRRY